MPSRRLHGVCQPQPRKISYRIAEESIFTRFKYEAVVMNTILIFHKLVYGRRRSCKSEQYAIAAYYSVRKCKVCLREGSSSHPSCTPGQI